ncbi:hypothetical protein GCM10023188_35930 [Pontibacter saemangeumensis]|uniref:Glycosyl transferase family 1 domain-containing protein n=1 Tax=Pontibacter saemangeumensis TaxID=1084525 RepID=A0ABP8M042_9BACT
MIIFSHPTGNANVRAAAIGLLDKSLLGNFYTSISTFPGDSLHRISTLSLFSEVSRRSFDPRLKSLTKMWPWREAGRLIASKAGLSKLVQHETGSFCIDAVYQSLDRRVARNLQKRARIGTNAIYAYEDGAYYSFKEAKRLNLECFYDLPIGYWRAAKRLLEKERFLKPEWAPTLVSFMDSDLKLANKDEELRFADRIFVASNFTASTLREFPGTLCPVEVIPYGFPPVSTGKDYTFFSKRRPLKLLFVGGLSQRKGIADLFAAVEALRNHVELTIVGLKPECCNCPALDTALAKHKWIPSMSHADILSLMQVQDVLVFPSLFEGFGLVITESMSQGTPVITTDRTAGPDLIEHGRNGWLVEAGSAQALQATIEELILRPSVISEVGKLAMDTAGRRPWELYGQELAMAIEKHLYTVV